MAAAQKTAKEGKGILATIFLLDPWRKLLALVVAVLGWIYVSDQILTIQILAFRVAAIPLESTDYQGYSLSIPTPPGFTLWSINGIPIHEKPRLKVRFAGPHNRMMLVTEDLKLAVLPEKILRLRAESRQVEIQAADITVPQHPELKELIQAILDPATGTPAPLTLIFERFLKDEPFALLGEVQIVGQNYPEGFEKDPERDPRFQPPQVNLSGPERLINGQVRGVQTGRERLLEDFVLRPELQIQRTVTDDSEVVQMLRLRPTWRAQGLTMTPEAVSVHLPLQRVPRVVNIPSLRLPVELSGPASEEWEIPRGAPDSRPVQLKVFNERDWRIVNDIKRLIPGEQSPDPKAQERWIRENVRLLVNVAHLDPAKKEEQDARIHARILPREGDFPLERLDIKVEVMEGAKIAVRKRR